MFSHYCHVTTTWRPCSIALQVNCKWTHTPLNQMTWLYTFLPRTHKHQPENWRRIAEGFQNHFISYFQTVFLKLPDSLVALSSWIVPPLALGRTFCLKPVSYFPPSGTKPSPLSAQDTASDSRTIRFRLRPSRVFKTDHHKHWTLCLYFCIRFLAVTACVAF